MALGDSLAALKVTIDADTTKLSAGLKDAEKQSKSWADSFGEKSKKIGIGMMALGGIVAGVMGKAVKDFTNTADGIDKMRARTGLSIKALQELKYAAKLSGGSLEGIESATKRMAMTLRLAATGSKATQASLKELGLTYEELKAMTPEQQFLALTSAIADIQDPTARAGMAMEIFGRQGSDLLPMLEGGSAGLKQMRDEAHRFGAVMGDDAVKAGVNFNDSMDRMDAAVNGLKNSLGTALIPALTDLVEKVSKVVARVGDWAEKNPALVKTLTQLALVVGVGGILFYAFSKLVAVIRTVAIALAAVQALSGPGGWAMLAAGLAIAAGAGIAIWKATEVPGMAEGGFVSKPTLAMIGESGPEAVIPLSGSGFGGMNVTVNVRGTVIAERDLAQTVREELLRLKTRNVSTGIS